MRRANEAFEACSAGLRLDEEVGTAGASETSFRPLLLKRSKEQYKEQ
jgi:hypothetical protein